MNNKKEVKEIEKLLANEQLYSIIWALLLRGQNVNQNKIRIINYVLKNKEASISQMCKDLKIDYKNAHRYVKQFQKQGIFAKDKEVSQGKKSKLKIKI